MKCFLQFGESLNVWSMIYIRDWWSSVTQRYRCRFLSLVCICRWCDQARKIPSHILLVMGLLNTLGNGWWSNRKSFISSSFNQMIVHFLSILSSLLLFFFSLLFSSIVGFQFTAMQLDPLLEMKRRNSDHDVHELFLQSFSRTRSCLCFVACTQSCSC